jgi:phosphatidylethanolamine N-methyltransferase
MLSSTYHHDVWRRAYADGCDSPHMRRLYGDSMRQDAGFVKVMKKVATSNAKLLETRAGRHAPALKSVAKEVKGTFDKVYEETADAVEDFLAKCTYYVALTARED